MMKKLLLTAFAAMLGLSASAKIQPLSEDAEPSLTVTQQKVFDGVAAEINKDTEFAKFTFVAEDMPGESEIYLTGQNAAMFSVDSYTIPAGSGVYVVTLTYHPTTIGKHKCNLMVEANPNDFSCMYQINAAAYDPANLPTITVPESVSQLSAAPGEQATTQFSISSANMFDYGTIAVVDQSTPGTFLISNTSLYPNISANFTLTFKPLQPGDYTAKIKVSAPMAEDKYISLSGTSNGTVPTPDKEGTELILDTSAPTILLNENFDNAEHNKPLMLRGWDNVAMQGLRAWWGYNFADDGNKAAKVTAYDSTTSDETPCEMLLVTPALDFKNAQSRIFTFSVMGDFLPEDGTEDVLEVLYIEDKDYMSPLEGMNIPAQADYNKQWIDYVIDFEDYDLADTFFIGFRLKSTRGRANSHVYYVDNVSWGRTDLPQIKALTDLIELQTEIGTDVLSEDIIVNGLNLSSDIKVQVTGDNASKFRASVSTLPKEGGIINVRFSPEEVGLHSANLQLSSEGAPTLLIPMYGLGNAANSINGITVDNGQLNIVNMQGISILRNGNTTDLHRLTPGIYIINGRKTVIR